MAVKIDERGEHRVFEGVGSEAFCSARGLPVALRGPTDVVAIAVPLAVRRHSDVVALTARAGYEVGQ